MAIFVLPHHNVVATVIASTFFQMINLAGRALVHITQAYHVLETFYAFRTTALLLEFALVCLTVKTV